jgi:hypothetical protein
MESTLRKMIAIERSGSVKEALSKFNPKVSENEGASDYITKTVDSPTSHPYVGKTTEIRIPLTDPNIHIVEFTKSFFTLRLQFEVYFPDGVPYFDKAPTGADHIAEWAEELSNSSYTDWWEDPKLVALAKAHYIFIGFKAAGDVIHQYKITHNGVDVRDTLTQKAQIESYLFNSTKPKPQWENKSGTMTQWEDVHNHNASVCGRYISYWDIKQNITAHNRLQIVFPVQIGFDDLLIFQAFDLFPSCAVGQLELVIMCSADALVWCCVDPTVTIPEYAERGNTNPYDVDSQELKDYLPYTDATSGLSASIDLYTAGHNITPFSTDCYYDRRFIQAYQWGRCATNIFKIKGTNPNFSYDFKDITVYSEKMEFEIARSTISGFKIKQAVVQALLQHYSETPMVIPTEIVRGYSFTTPPADGGLNCVINLTMPHVKEVVVLFPRLASDLTCFLNPMLENLQIRFANKVFPERGIQTNTHEFLRWTTENCDLDSILAAAESFENSIIVPVQTKEPFRDRSLSDNTCFSFFVPCERRSCNAFFFNGVDSPHETITLTGTPICKEGRQDTYLYNHRHNNKYNVGNKNGTPPLLCLITDTFWLFSSNRAAVYETSRSWDEVFSSHYNGLYNQLLGDVGLKNPLATSRR